MQRKKTITITGNGVIGVTEVTITEISVSKVLAMLRGENSIISLPLPAMLEEFKQLLPLAMDVPLDKLLAGDLYYDDLTALYDAFKETNPAFFESARALNLDGALAGFLKTLIASFSGRLLTSLNSGTVPDALSTDSDISST
jgi:hypothetical protein